ncbi:MAG TPA: RDD family protein [Arenimonas sp.]|nr:RDD family protein [Arenimonas sp.]
MDTASAPTAARPAHLGWRLLALLYDTLPALALWFLGAAVMLALTFGRTVAPGSIEAWMELLWLWLLTGAYAVISWRLGGQTLGMRPWRLRVTDAQGQRASWSALCLRYAVATVSLAAFGLGLLWSLIDRQHRSWHDLASGTLMVRMDPSR